MPHWQIQTYPSQENGQLSGVFSDDDLRFRLHALGSTLLRAEAAVIEAQAAFDRDVASGRKNNQDRIVDEALKVLAEKRTRG